MGLRPFLKWAGGKSNALPSLAKFVPSQFNKYIEPFLGGGALFFHILPEKAIIADSNEELINCYETVRDNLEPLLNDLQRHPCNEKYYYEMRDITPDSLSSVERASRFIFLNKTCYNGLYRVNKQGKFNVPFGRYKNPFPLCNANRLREISRSLKNVNILCCDYKDCLLRYAEENDFVYLDPPYHPISRYSDFNRYTKDFFGKKEQDELAKIFRWLGDRGCYVLLSNSFAPYVLELYEGYTQEVIEAKRYINKIGERRKGVKELLILNERIKNETYVYAKETSITLLK